MCEIHISVQLFLDGVGTRKKRKQEPGRVQFVRAKSLRWSFVITFPATGRSNGSIRDMSKNTGWQTFPGLPSYNRFVEVMADVLIPIAAFMQSRCGTGKGIAFIDSTSLCVCKNIRIPRHKTFKDVAGRGKSSTGWFYGFKLHLMVDDCGEILSFSITRGNVDDRVPVPKMAKNFIGKLFGDKGYISKKLAELLAVDDVELITKLKKNMKPKVIALFDKILLRKRSIIETINDPLYWKCCWSIHVFKNILFLQPPCGSTILTIVSASPPPLASLRKSGQRRGRGESLYHVICLP